MSFARRIVIAHIFTAITLVALAGAGQVAQAAPSQQGGDTVQMVDNQFQPQTMTVPVGTTVTWTNVGNSAHTATSDTGVFDTGTVNPGQSGSFTFDQPGTYPYFCRFHGAPSGGGMVGTIIVEAAQTQPSPAPSPPASPAPSPPASPAPSAPRTMPNTGAGDFPLALIAVPFVLLAAGLVTRRYAMLARR